MNIVYIIPSLANTGPIIVVKELVEQFVVHGHYCDVFYLDDKVDVEFDCPVYKLIHGKGIDFTKYDIVHSHGMRPDRYVSKYREYSGKVKYISTIHCYAFDDFKYQYNWIISQVFGRLWLNALKKHDKIVTLSLHATQYYKEWFLPNRLTYAYNGRKLDSNASLTVAELKELYEFKGNSILIGINASLTGIKGVDMVVKALVRLNKFKLFVVGEGKIKVDLINLARKLGVDDRCYFAGYRLDAYRYVCHYDVFAMPSRNEGFGLTLIEAAFFKTPCVCSNIPIFKELFSSNEVSFFELENIEDLARAINNAAENSDLGLQMHKKYLKSYLPQQMYQKYLDIYNGKI